MRMFILTALLAIFTAAALAQDAPFKHPRAVQAQKRYQFRLEQARASYDKEVAAAKREYLAGLDEAGKAVAQAGNLDEVKAIAEAKENIPPASPELGETFQGSRYLLIPAGAFWKNAQYMCESLGGNLVCITSKEEAEFVAKLAKGRKIWIGLTRDGSAGNWRWVTGEPMPYTPWAKQQPDNAGGIEAFAEMLRDGTWNDLPNREWRAFVCEWKN